MSRVPRRRRHLAPAFTRLTAAIIAPIVLAGCASTAPRMADSRAALATRIVDYAADVPALANSPEFARAMAAIGSVPREQFVPHRLRARAYAERSLPIGYDQTISDPYIVAIMTASAQVAPDMRALEIGTGSGYQAAVLSRIASRVYTIEIVRPLARRAARTLAAHHYSNVQVRAGDGFAGWPDAAPFDAILVTAGAASPPAPLLDQLAPGGRMVMPIGPSTAQEQLIVFHKRADGGIERCVVGNAMFVPLTGRGERPEQPGIRERGLPFCYGADAGKWSFSPADPTPPLARRTRPR
ncbi:protein-L-isoaspartate(D-aspartate) O-methyltransferase [Sphingomonas sp.]|uniref:protein-L-isoaspartate(D-aspartate) O-methyltransferase n=1 Tax=Sphingomonas sp. TaxID=28214 RepID=UPI001EB344AF|nr:protein-L-isoaspartate(D-aspartate) O-methyltransferase [Sphingomonas sp.]MBX3593066.1 protein-L-isoaspartate(D-aspartate) O-methyltransferase [Sphingomonas sp.]